MSILKQKDVYITTAILASVLIFIFSLYINPHTDLFATLSLAFTIISAIATLATLIIAILLYDKFGLGQKLIVKQTDKVFELVDLLKGKVITVKTKGFSYFIRPSIHQLKLLKSMSHFKNDAQKEILISDEDYTIGLKDIMSIKRSYWLPKEIQEKMNFLEVAMIVTVNNNEINKFALLDMGTGIKGKSGLFIPKVTFETFNNQLEDLISEIESWMKKHSINIDFKMEEPENL